MDTAVNGDDQIGVADRSDETNAAQLEGTIAPPQPITAADEQSAIYKRIVAALGYAREYANSLPDPNHTLNLLKRLRRSGVHGSFINGFANGEADDDKVDRLIASIRNWVEVPTALKDITCFSGELPDDIEAFAAYATIREIDSLFRGPGLDTIRVRRGTQRKGEFYLCSQTRMPTRTFTVHLKMDANQGEFIVHWFAGQEVKSIIHQDEGDIVIRMGCQLPTANVRRPQFQPRQAPGN